MEARIETEWRDLGFYFAQRKGLNERRLVGSCRGLRRFRDLLIASVSDPRNLRESEHEHYGPFGSLRETADLLERDPALNRNPQARGMLGYAYARTGRRDEARRMAAQTTFPNEQALILAGLGDKDGTFEALGRM